MQRINEKLAEISTFDSQPMGRGQTDKLLMVIRMLSWINSDYWITMGGGVAAFLSEVFVLPSNLLYNQTNRSSTTYNSVC